MSPERSPVGRGYCCRQAMMSGGFSHTGACEVQNEKDLTAAYMMLGVPRRVSK